MSYSIQMTDPVHGRTLIASPDPDAHLYLLEDGMEGFGATELIVETEPYADGTGGHPVTRRFGERTLTLVGELTQETDALRRLICSIMSPKATLTMEVTLGGVTRTLSVIPWGRPRFRRPHFFAPTTVILRFIAPDPFYRDVTPRTVPFRYTVPLLTFPMNFWSGAGTAAGYYRNTDTITVNNPGDTDCGFDAWLTAVDGPVVKPAIVLGSRTIRLTDTLTAGQTAHIDTHPRSKNLWIDHQRSFTFQRDSDFFLLPVGENSLSVTAESGVENLSATLTYTPLYYGI